MSVESLCIAQVSPHPWGARHEINEFVRRTSEELAARGHRVLIAAPSESRTAIRESRRLIRDAGKDPGALDAALGDLGRLGGERVLELRTALRVANLGLGQVTDDFVPVRILAIQPTEAIIEVTGWSGNEHAGEAQALRWSGKATDELEGDRKALVRVVDGGDLEGWHVKPLAEHVHANDDLGAAVADRRKRFELRFPRELAVDPGRVELRAEFLVHPATMRWLA